MAKKESKIIRVGIIGLGRAGFGMQSFELAARAGKFSVVAGCDLVPARRKRFAEKFPEAAVYADAEKLIANPDVDLVTVATRTPTHVEWAVKALRAGKFVMCEKPIAVTQADSLKLQAADKKFPGKLFIRQNRRYEAAFNDITDIIHTGILGDIYEIKLCRHNFARRDDWQTVVSEGGGQLLNWGPHIVDHALQFLESPVDSIQCELRRIAAVGDAEDHVHMELRGKNGRIVDIEISGGAAIGEPVYWIAGTKGALVSWDERTIDLRYLDPMAKLPARRVKLGLMDTFGTIEQLPWIEEKRQVRTDIAPDSIWDNLYDHLTKGVPFRVKNAEAFEVMRILALAGKKRGK